MNSARSMVILASLLVGCSSTEPRRNDVVVDAPVVGTIVDAPIRDITLPTWMLEDVQPQSPRASQTYGLDSFGGKVVVVTLVEGY